MRRVTSTPPPRPSRRPMRTATCWRRVPADPRTPTHYSRQPPSKLKTLSLFLSASYRTRPAKVILYSVLCIDTKLLEARRDSKSRESKFVCDAHLSLFFSLLLNCISTKLMQLSFYSEYIMYIVYGYCHVQQ